MRARTRGEELQLLGECYADTLGRRPAPVILEDMERLLDRGMEAAVIMLALDATASAPRPSWAYCRAILAACLRDGATTVEGWHARQDRWAGRQRSQGQDYTQRTYTAEERRSFFTDLESDQA